MLVASLYHFSINCAILRSRLSWASGLKYPIGDFTVLTLQSRLSWASGLNMRYVPLRCCDSVSPFVGAWFVFFVFHEGVNHIVFIKLIYAFYGAMSNR